MRKVVTMILTRTLVMTDVGDGVNPVAGSECDNCKNNNSVIPICDSFCGISMTEKPNASSVTEL